MTTHPHFTGTFAVAGDVATVLEAMFGKQQHDAHMTMWRFVNKFYGGPKGWASERLGRAVTDDDFTASIDRGRQLAAAE